MGNLDNLIKYLCESKSIFITSKNMELEREYFSSYRNNVPLREIMQNASYEDHVYNYKEAFKDANEEDLQGMMTILEEYFFFSNGHDMMYKMKLEADMYVTPFMDDFILPLLSVQVKKRFDDDSVSGNNPNAEANTDEVNKIVNMFIDLQSLLNLLYCNDFQFPRGWQGISSENHQQIIEILDESEVTIGDFLHALVDYKCGILLDIVLQIGDTKLKEEYVRHVDELRKAKHEEIGTFIHIGLPVTYFLTHTIMDFIADTGKRMDEEEPDGAKKILVPNGEQ